MHEFLKYLRKSLENCRGKKKEDECEKVLGLNGKVQEFAGFYERHEHDILTFIAAALHKWEAENEFDKDDLALYRLGLTELPVFLEKCVKERDRKHAERLAEIQQLSEQQAAVGT
jgi:hypothetical protein